MKIVRSFILTTSFHHKMTKKAKPTEGLGPFGFIIQAQRRAVCNGEPLTIWFSMLYMKNVKPCSEFFYLISDRLL